MTIKITFLPHSFHTVTTCAVAYSLKVTFSVLKIAEFWEVKETFNRC